VECGSLLPLFGAEAGFRASDQPAEPAIAGDANRAAKIVAVSCGSAKRRQAAALQGRGPAVRDHGCGECPPRSFAVRVVTAGPNPTSSSPGKAAVCDILRGQEPGGEIAAQDF